MDGCEVPIVPDRRSGCTCILYHVDLPKITPKLTLVWFHKPFIRYCEHDRRLDTHSDFCARADSSRATTFHPIPSAAHG